MYLVYSYYPNKPQKPKRLNFPIPTKLEEPKSLKVRYWGSKYYTPNPKHDLQSQLQELADFIRLCLQHVLKSRGNPTVTV